MFGISLPNPLEALGQVKDAAAGWVADNWKTIAAVGASTLVFAGVITLCALCPVAIPAVLAFGAAGFASGVTFYGFTQMLDGKPVDPKEALIQGGISAIVTVGTAGVARLAAPALSRFVAPVASRVIPEAASAAVPGALRAAATNGTIGAAFGGGLKVAENAVTGRPLGEGVGDAATLGAVQGLIATPVMGSLQRVMGGGASPLADAAPVLRRAPSLEWDIAALKAAGWRFEYGKPYGGTFCDYTTGRIVIDPTNTSFQRVFGLRSAAASEIVDSLAHEVGHARTGAPRYTPPEVAGDRATYVRENTRAYLDSEGHAALNENVVKAEVLRNGGPDIGGSTRGEYARIANDPTLTVEEKVRRLGDLYAKNTPSTEPFWKLLIGRARIYQDFYGDHFAAHWDRTQLPAPSSSKGILGGLDGASR